MFSFFLGIAFTSFLFLRFLSILVVHIVFYVVFSYTDFTGHCHARVNSKGVISMEKITINDLREHLDYYSAEFQKMTSDPSISPEYQSLFDTLSRNCHYMFSEIIDYLDQVE